MDNSKGQLPQSRTSPQILRMADVRARTSLSNATIFELIARGVFPAPFKIVPNGRATGWLSAVVDAWIEARASDTRSVTQ